MAEYYLPHMMTLEEYTDMGVRFWRILTSLPEFKESMSLWKGSKRSIIRFRKDNLTVVFSFSTTSLGDRLQIKVECGDKVDVFVVHDVNTSLDCTLALAKVHQPSGSFGEVNVRAECLDFLDDYCTYS